MQSWKFAPVSAVSDPTIPDHIEDALEDIAKNLSKKPREQKECANILKQLYLMR